MFRGMNMRNGGEMQYESETPRAKRKNIGISLWRVEDKLMLTGQRLADGTGTGKEMKDAAIYTAWTVVVCS